MSDILLLMQKDPLKHTEQDIDAIIAHLRSQRHAFNTVKTKAVGGGKAAPAKPSGPIDLGDITL